MVPINPCGRVCDFARREYRTKCRFFRDSPVEVEIQWYRAAPDAPSLGFPSSILSLDWTNDEADRPYLQRPGEVFGEPRPYSFHGPLIDPTYAHVCGTPEEFQLGAVFDADRDVQYDEQGLPLCCDQPVTPMMGVVLGLEVEESSGVLPGETCEDATTLAAGEIGVGAVNTGVDNWWTAPAVMGQDIRVHVGLAAGAVDVRALVGDDCDTAVGVAGGVFGAPGGMFDFTTPADGTLFLKAVYVHAAPMPTHFAVQFEVL